MSNLGPTIKANDFPPLQNRFGALTLLGEDNAILKENHQSNSSHETLACKSFVNECTSVKPRPNKAKVLDKAEVNLHNKSRPVFKPEPMNINVCADSQGRGVFKDILKDSSHKSLSFVKPSAKFQRVTEETLSARLGSRDLAVLLAGTNDVARNESQDLLSSLRKSLYNLRSARKVCVFSVPKRYDLPEWSIVNKEVDNANMKMSQTCKRFKNAIFVDLSQLGRRFYTPHGLHLNNLGKKFVSSSIVDLANNCI